MKKIIVIIGIIAILAISYVSYMAGVLTTVKIINDRCKEQGEVEFSTGNYFDNIHFIATKIE